MSNLERSLACGLLLLLSGCASPSAPSPALDAGSPPPPTWQRDGGVERDEDPAQPTPEPGAQPPRAADPCDQDLEVVNGRVTPDVGALPPSTELHGDPAQPGPYAVTRQDFEVPIHGGVKQAVGYTVELTDARQPATAYLPDGAGDALPLVVVLAGFQASYTMYETFSEHFASHGFAVVGLDTRSELTRASHDKESWEVVQAIDFVLGGGSPLGDRVDGSKIAVAGHSKGGKLSFFVASMDPRVDQVIAWDPQNAGGPPCAIGGLIGADCNAQPVAPNCGALDTGTPQPEGTLHHMHAASLVLAAPEDGLVTPEPNHNARHFYRGAPSPAAYVLFDAGHLAWPGDADVVRISKALQVATLLARFKGVTGLERYLPGGGYAAAEAKVREVHTK